jgi:WD40 repeat protein
MTGQRRPGVRPPSDVWVAAIHQAANATLPLGSGFLIDTRRVLTCAHVVHDKGDVRSDLWVTFPKADELMHLRVPVEQVVAPPTHQQDVQDVAVLVLGEEIAPEYVARLRRPAAGDLVDRSWWSFGFPDGVLGNSADGSVGEALGFGWVRLDTSSRYPVRPGYSGAALWSADYDAVVGLVGQARRDSGDARALTLKTVDLVLPEQKLRLLTDWSVEAAGDAALSAWGWTLAGDAESGRHWRPRARGVSTDAERGFRFRGRGAALTAVVEWMTTRERDRRQVLVVTGSPGVGKSAVLGRVVTTADAQIAAALPAGDWGVRAPVGSVACAVHARDKTAVEVAREIATAASARLPEQVKELPDLLREALGKDDRGSFCVVIDALDEATTPQNARVILQTAISLAETCADLGVRVVVGSRRVDDAGDLLAPFAGALKIIDLDVPEFFAPDDLVAYALATLQLVGDERVNSPYQDDQVAAAVAQRIAKMAQGNFLIAGLVARSHGMHDQEAIAVEQLRYTSTVEAALRDYLSRLPALKGVPAQDLLTALAYAESPGLTLSLWRRVVQAMTGQVVDEGALFGFVRSAAANFLVESSDSATHSGSFRLFHQALNEALLAPRAAAALLVHDERTIARALMDTAGDSSWATVPGYVLRSLPGHAARGGIIDELLQNDAYALYADLRRLVPAAKASLSPAGRARARLLRKTPQALEAGPRERMALFTVTEAREQLGRSFRDRRASAPYRAVWAVGAPHAEDIVLEGHTAWINALCPVPVGSRMLLASASNDHTIRLWDADTGETVRILTGHTGPVRALACLTHRGRTLLASAGTDARIRLWDPATGQVVRVLASEGAWINALCPVVVGQQMLLASAGNDQGIRLWDWQTGVLVRTVEQHTDWVRTLTSFRVGRRSVMASAGHDTAVRLWEGSSGQIVPGGFEGHTDWVTSVCVLAWGEHTLLASAGNDSAIRLWDVQAGPPMPAVDQGGAVTAVCAMTVHGKTYVASAESDHRVLVRDAATGEVITVLEGHADWVRTLCVMPIGDEFHLATGGDDGRILVWHTARATILRTLPGHDDVLTGLCPVRVGGRTLLASASSDRTLRLWDPATHAHCLAQESFDSAIAALSTVIVEGQQLVAAGFEDGSIVLWDPERRRTRRVWPAHSEPITALTTVSLQGQPLLVSASGDHTIQVWDPTTGQAGQRLDGHSGKITTLMAGTHGSRGRLISASDDRTLRVWDLQASHPTMSITVHSPAWDVTSSGDLVVVGLSDGLLALALE